MYMKKALLISFSLILMTALQAQQRRSVLHLSQSFYVSGEVIWFQLFTPDYIETANKVFEVSVFKSNGEKVYQYFVKGEKNGGISGYLTVGLDWPSDMYVFMVSGRTIEQEQIDLVQHIVPIYQDGVDIEKLSSEVDVILAGEQEQLISSSSIGITIDQASYKTGENIQINISSPGSSGEQVSLSILDQALGGTQVLNRPSWRLGKTLREGTQFLSSINLRGRIVNETGFPIETNSLAAYMPQERRLIYASSNTNGYFVLELPFFFGLRRLQLLDYSNSSAKISWEKPLQLISTPPLVYTPGVLEYIRLSQQRKKIYQLFSSTEIPLSIEYPALPVVNYEADQTINMEEYDSFRDLPTFFKEIVTPYKFRTTNDGGYDMRMFNPSRYNRKFYPLSPIIMIEDYITRDDNFVASLDPTQLNRIELYFDERKLEKQFGFLGLSGVVALYADQKLPAPPSDALNNTIAINGLVPSAEFPYERPASNQDDIRPDFRPTVYWNANLQLDEGGQAQIELPAPQDKSRFRIMVVNKNGEITTKVFEVSLIP